MTIAKYLLLAAAVVSVAACGDDDGASPRGPTALVRLVNGSPDAGSVNLIFVDKLENLPTFQKVPFRGSSGLYQQVEAGERQVRVFFNTTDVDSAKVRLVDATVTLEAGQTYTLLYMGTVAGDADQLLVIPETIPDDPAAGSIAVKVLHAGFGMGAVDVYAADSAADPMAAPEETFAGVAVGAATGYATLPALGDDELYEFAVAPAGGAAASFSVSPDSPGAPADGTLSAQAGVRQSGSVLSVLVLPGAVSGSRSATKVKGVETNLNPTAIILLDNVPGT